MLTACALVKYELSITLLEKTLSETSRAMTLLDEILCCDVFVNRLFCVKDSIVCDTPRVVEVSCFAVCLNE